MLGLQDLIKAGALETSLCLVQLTSILFDHLIMPKNSQISGLLALTLAGACTAQTACTASVYSQIAPCVASSTAIVLNNVFAPSGSSIDLTGVKAGTTITFAGKTTFGFTNDSSFEPIKLGGSGITVTAEPDAIIDGNGQVYWDGLGSNGGVPKYVYTTIQWPCS